MSVKIELDDEQTDKIIHDEMRFMIECFERDIEERDQGKGMAIFDSDPKKDVVYLVEHIAAFKLVLDWCGGDVYSD